MTSKPPPIFIDPPGIPSAEAVGGATVTLQIFFSRYHLFAARSFRDQLARLEAPGSTFSHEHRSLCMACIISSACFVEALANEVAEATNNPSFANVYGFAARLAAASTSRATLLLDPKQTPSRTLRKLAELANKYGISVDLRSEPWASAQALFTLRNALVHAKPVDTASFAAAVTRLEGDFSARGIDLNPQFPTPANPFFPDRLLGHGCCRWTVQVAENLAAWFADTIGVPHFFEP